MEGHTGFALDSWSCVATVQQLLQAGVIKTLNASVKNANNGRNRMVQVDSSKILIDSSADFNAQGSVCKIVLQAAMRTIDIDL